MRAVPHAPEFSCRAKCVQQTTSRSYTVYHSQKLCACAVAGHPATRLAAHACNAVVSMRYATAQALTAACQVTPSGLNKAVQKFTNKSTCWCITSAGLLPAHIDVHPRARQYVIGTLNKLKPHIYCTPSGRAALYRACNQEAVSRAIYL